MARPRRTGTPSPFVREIEHYRQVAALELRFTPRWRWIRRRTLRRQIHNGPSWHSFKGVKREG